MTNPSPPGAGELPSEPAPAANRAIFWAVAINLAIVLLGYLLIYKTAGEGFAFYVLFRRHEPLGLSILLLFLFVGFWLLIIRRVTWSFAWRPSGRWPLVLLALGVLGLTWVGCLSIYHAYPLSMDEFAAEFQAKVFARGDLAGQVADRWRPFLPAAEPIFIASDVSTGTQHSLYLPVYSALRAVLVAIDPSLLLNPLLAALSVLLLAKVARQLWPEEDAAPWIAVLLLVSSAQFLITSMSFYSMPAHLALNLLWLHLYLRDDRPGWALLPWVGVLAMGLHQYTMHALFAAPFLFRQVLDRKLGRCLWLAGVYLAGLAGWIAWMETWREMGNAEIVKELFGLPGLQQTIDQGINLVNTVSWQVPGFGVLLVLVLVEARRLSRPLQDLMASVLLSAGFHLFIQLNQGHGWGNRYLYGTLGNQILLATAGGLLLARHLGTGRARAALALSLLTAWGIQIPARVIQVETFVSPFATASAYLQTLEATSVVIDSGTLWYSWDLIRNDPYFADGPVIVDLRRLLPETYRRLEALGPVRLVPPAELERLGMEPLPGAPR